MNYFIFFTSFHSSRENMNSQLASLSKCGFIAQLVEHRTGITEVKGSNLVEALNFSRLLYSNCLNWKFTAKIISYFHLHPQLIYKLFHIRYLISLFTGKYELTIDLAPNV